MFLSSTTWKLYTTNPCTTVRLPPIVFPFVTADAAVSDAAENFVCTPDSIVCGRLMVPCIVGGCVVCVPYTCADAADTPTIAIIATPIMMASILWFLKKSFVFIEYEYHI